MYASADNANANMFNCIQVSVSSPCYPLAYTDFQDLKAYIKPLQRQAQGHLPCLIVVPPMMFVAATVLNTISQKTKTLLQLTSNTVALHKFSQRLRRSSWPKQLFTSGCLCRERIRTAWRISQVISSLPSFLALRYETGCCASSEQVQLCPYCKVLSNCIMSMLQSCASPKCISDQYIHLPQSSSAYRSTPMCHEWLFKLTSFVPVMTALFIKFEHVMWMSASGTSRLKYQLISCSSFAVSSLCSTDLWACPAG